MPRMGKTAPRLWTRPLRPLTEDTSLGFEAIRFAEESLGRPLHPWQKWFLIHSLELAVGSYVWDDYPVLRFKTVILLVARQNGKSYLLSTRMLWRMFMWDGPEQDPTLVLGAAHVLSLAQETLDLSHAALNRSEDLRPQLLRKINTNGDKHFELTDGTRYRCAASSDDGGRGFSVTDLGFDELRQQREWSPWAAMTNTTNAIHSSQVIGVSNAGEAKSEVLRSLRSKGIAEIEDYLAHIAGGGTDETWGARENPATMGLFEYSAPEDCDIHDPEGWAQANPSMGYPGGPTEATLRAIADLVGEPGQGTPEHKFRTENLCQWVNAAAEGPFSQELIDAGTDPESQIAEGSKLYVAVDVSADRKTSWVSVIGYREDGKVHAELIAKRPNTEWLPEFLANSLAFEHEGVVVQGKGAPISSLIELIERAGVTVLKCESSNLPAACGQLHDRIHNGSLKWRNQPGLLVALKEAVKKHYGDVWSWNRDSSPVDVAPLCAVTVGVWALTNDIAAPGKVTAYGEDYGAWWDMGRPEPALATAGAPTTTTTEDDDDERWW